MHLLWRVTSNQIYHSICWLNFFLKLVTFGEFTPKMVDCVICLIHLRLLSSKTRNSPDKWNNLCIMGQKLFVPMLIDRLMWVYYQQISNCCRPVLTYWETYAISDCWSSVPPLLKPWRRPWFCNRFITVHSSTTNTTSGTVYRTSLYGEIIFWTKCCKKYENIPKHVEVMLKNKVALFLWDTVYSVVHKTLHAYNDTKRSQASSNISAIWSKCLCMSTW